MENRIYGRRTPISSESVQAFFDKRAAQAGVSSLGAVLLGNQDSEFLGRRNDYDRDNILPLLNIGPETRVLDIGCGNGRWARFILPNCGFYCGIDFSSGMVRSAEKTCQELGGNYRLHSLSAAEAVERDAQFYGGKFDVVIVSGVFMYINDQEAAQIVTRLPGLMKESCMFYSSEPVGRQERLTLNDFPSEALKTAYSAIYRTTDEYMELCAPLFAAGFSMITQGFRPQYGESYTDTGRYHMVMGRQPMEAGRGPHSVPADGERLDAQP